MKQSASNNIAVSSLPAGMQVTLSQDKMAAFLSLAAGYAGSLEETIQALAQERITHGVDTAAIETAIRQASEGVAVENAKVATGESPCEAEGGRIDLFFQTAKPQPDPNSRTNVDLREVNRFVVVRKGEMLAELIPHKPGKNGYNVLGKTLTPHRSRARSISLCAGKNVIRDNENHFFAATDGIILRDRDTLSIQDELEISGDVDYSTGNIRFPGSIRIKGSVTPDFKVETEGNLHITGHVQDAHVSSLGNITISQGIVGEGKSVVLAKGSITAGWIENSAVEAGEDVTVRSHIFHSRVNAEGWIRAITGKGAIVGGEVWAAKGIEVRIIGSESVSGTIVAIGGGLAINKQIEDLTKHLEEYNKSIQKIRVALGIPLLSLLLAAPEHIAKVPLARREAIRTLLEKYHRLTNESAKIETQRAELTIKLHEGFNGEIKALAKAYPGSIITIGRLSQEIKTETDKAIFHGNFELGDIVMQPL